MADPAVIAAYHSGLEALGSVASRIPPDGWSNMTACEGWTAKDLAGHVLIVSRWWHVWLDEALAGNAEPPFHWNDPERIADKTLADLADASGPERMAEWARTASSYVRRIADVWDLPYGCPPGSVSVVPMTVGVHARLGAMEWHIHAWDLAAAIGEAPRPTDEDALQLEEGLRVFGLPQAEGDPWDAVITMSGRTPR